MTTGTFVKGQVSSKRKLGPRVATCLTVALQVTAGRPTDSVPMQNTR